MSASTTSPSPLRFFLRQGCLLWVLAIILCLTSRQAHSAEVGAVDKQLSLSVEEQAWLVAHGPLRYAPDRTFPPIEWMDENGTPHGIVPEMLGLLAERLHTSIKPVRIESWSLVLQAAKEGRVDLIGCIAPTEERRAYLHFTKPYISTSIVAFVRANAKLESVADLKGHRVGVVKDYIVYDRLMKEPQGFTVVPVASTREGMAMLALGKMDAMIETLGVGSFVITHEAIDGLRILPGDVQAFPQSYSVAAPDPILAGLLQKALDSIEESELKLIIKKHTPVIERVKESFVPPWVWQTILGGILVLLLATTWAITLRKRLEVKEALLRQEFEKKAELEARFSDLAQNASDLLMTWDASGRITSGNAALVHTLGYSLDELLCMSVFDLVAAEHRANFQLQLSTTVPDGAGRTHELQMLSRDGQALWFEVKTRSISSDRSTQAISRDISQRIEAQHNLESEKQFLKRLVEAVPGAVWMADPSGRIRWTNEYALRLLGKKSDETLDRFGYEVLPGDQAQAIRSQALAAMSKREPVRCDQVSKLPDGRLMVTDLVLSPMFSVGGECLGVLGIGIDVSEQRRMQEMLLQSQKLDSIGQLAGGIAHDFNNVLGAMMLQLDYLRMTGHCDKEAVGQIGELYDSAKRAAGLTRQLLIFSRQQVTQIKAVDLDSLLGELLKMLRRLISENIHIDFDGVPKASWVMADSGMLEQIVMNLVVNARDAMPRGGSIHVSTTLVDISPGELSVHSAPRSGRFVCLRVSDTGCGMDKATLARIFEPFFTTKEPGKGTGLGLATVYGIVKKHEGWLKVESEPGKGTSFSVYLPSTEPVHGEYHASDAWDLPRGQGETILLVEDDGIVRKKAKAMLEQAGYRVFIAMNGPEALLLWEEHAATIKLLLTDMIMPEQVNGLDLARRFMAEAPALQVIIMSGYSLELSQEDVFTTKQLHYLAKPFEARALFRLVASCLEKAA